MEIVQNEPLPLEVALMAKIHEVANAHPRYSHVVEQLRFVFRQYFRNGLEFHDDSTKHE